MGCSNSTPVHPSIYNELLKTKPIRNGEIKEKTKVEDIAPNHMRGDYSQFQLAKHNRERHHKERQFKLFMAADEMTGKMIEDREMLSLGTRSRGTSRNTSRATSPSGNKRGQHSDHVTPMTPVAEDKLSRGASLRSLKSGSEHTETTPKKKQKHHKQSKNKSKTKKHKKGKKSKKGKKIKGKDESDKEDLDSGMEDENDNEEENSEPDSDKENQTNKVPLTNQQIRNIPSNADSSAISNTGNVGQHVTVLPLHESPSGVRQGETPLVSNRSVREIKIQSGSKDSGIAESGVNDSSKQVSGEQSSAPNKSDRNDEQTEERSDSRI